MWALWHAAFPEKELHSLISDQWKEMGWQGKDPSTDFRLDLFSLNPLVHLFFNLFHIVAYNLHMTYYYDRGGGFISLENLLYFAGNFPV